MKLHELFKSPTPPTDFEVLDEVFIATGDCVEYLDEGRKWISGRFQNNIGIDQSTARAGLGEPHAHVLGRRGDEIGVVNKSGSGSHGSKFKLHPDDAAALRARGWDIGADNLVEWISAGHITVLFG